MTEDYIGFVCPMCGEQYYMPSMIVLCPDFGSAHDGERISIQICGACMDKLITAICLLDSAIQQAN